MSNTTHILNAIKDAYAAGLADGAAQAAVIARIHADHCSDVNNHFHAAKAPGIARKPRTAPAPSMPAVKIIQPKKPKAVSRGVKKTGAPREKGVKDGIMASMKDGGNTLQDIIARTGYKATSVRGTLMQMKKKGLAIVRGRGADALWSLISAPSNGSVKHAEIHA